MEPGPGPVKQAGCGWWGLAVFQRCQGRRPVRKQILCPAFPAPLRRVFHRSRHHTRFFCRFHHRFHNVGRIPLVGNQKILQLVMNFAAFFATQATNPQRPPRSIATKALAAAATDDEQDSAATRTRGLLPTPYIKTPSRVFSTSSKSDTMTMLLGRPRHGQWFRLIHARKGDVFSFL